MITVHNDTDKFGVWLETQDGSKVYLNTKAVKDLMFDLDQAWFDWIGRGFDGVVDQ